MTNISFFLASGDNDFEVDHTELSCLETGRNKYAHHLQNRPRCMSRGSQVLVQAMTATVSNNLKKRQGLGANATTSFSLDMSCTSCACPIVVDYTQYILYY